MRIRKKKEIANKIDDLYKSIKRGELDVMRGIIAADALSWVLGEDYLDVYPYVITDEDKDLDEEFKKLAEKESLIDFVKMIKEIGDKE